MGILSFRCQGMGSRGFNSGGVGLRALLRLQGWAMALGLWGGRVFEFRAPLWASGSKGSWFRASGFCRSGAFRT